MKQIAKIILLLEIFLVFYAIFSKITLFPAKRTLNFAGEKILTVNDNGLEYFIKTKASNLSGTLEENKINVSSEDVIIPAKDSEIYPNMTIAIIRPANIMISVDGQSIKKLTFAKTVGDALLENKITLSHLDEIDPGLETRLSNDMKVTVTRIKSEEVTEDEDIDFKEVAQMDGKVDWGEKDVSQEGEKGTRETSYRINYENGAEVSRVKLSSKITKQPVTQIVKIGTRLKIGKSDSGIASWYNAGIDECASRDFPAGTWLRVTNLTNGKQTYTRVAGYGPQPSTGKKIDLDNKTFEKIAPLGQGTTRVKIEEILSKGFSPNAINPSH